MEVRGLASCPCCFTSWGISLGIHWLGGWVCARAVVWTRWRREKNFPCRELKHGRPARSLLSILTAISAPKRHWESEIKAHAFPTLESFFYADEFLNSKFVNILEGAPKCTSLFILTLQYIDRLFFLPVLL